MVKVCHEIQPTATITNQYNLTSSPFFPWCCIEHEDCDHALCYQYSSCFAWEQAFLKVLIHKVISWILLSQIDLLSGFKLYHLTFKNTTRNSNPFVGNNCILDSISYSVGNSCPPGINCKMSFCGSMGHKPLPLQVLSG